MPSADPGQSSRQYADYDQIADSVTRMSLSQYSPRPPRTIADLAEEAKEGTTDESLPLKQWLRNAEGARKQGRLALEAKDYETAFVEMARAATIVLERLPAHKDYRNLLNATQRRNLGLHGQEILDTLGPIKETLLRQADDYARTSPTSTTNQPPRISPHVRALAAPPAMSTPSSSGQGSRSSHHVPSPTVNLSEGPPHNGGPVPISHVRASGYSTQQQPVLEPRREVDPQLEQQRQQQREEQRRREDAINRQVMDEQRRKDQEGIMRRQREAEAAVQVARSTSVSSQPSATTATNGVVAMPTPNASNLQVTRAPFLQFPLESPVRPSSNSAGWSSRSQMGSLITTTSPPPPELSAIQYPSLMSQHQIKQGYAPSIASMFHHPQQVSDVSASNLYTTPLPRISAPVVIPPSSGSYVPSRRAPDPPAPPPVPVPAPPQHQRTPSGRAGGLRRVEFPYECLNRFVSIAAVNTKRNRETCGLLLGRDHGSHYVVTTLLIPKQSSTSDTCTMDGEELVLQFTEQRSLITLGWIHTHPTQSCFMSSVDLHTHSGFQMMLPESFAVVCAPKSQPNFGIFRLTDPVGLQTILRCTAKEAFHPHPDVAIYTDVDKNHVHLNQDIKLEIVDLR